MNDKASILIVDDEEVVRRSHLRSLADTGCRAEAAGDGQEAIQYAKAGHKVLSFEPTPSKSAKIRAALEKAGVEESVDFYSYAISDTSGTAPFVVNVGVHMVNGQWVVNEGESKKAEERM